MNVQRKHYSNKDQSRRWGEEDAEDIEGNEGVNQRRG